MKFVLVVLLAAALGWAIGAEVRRHRVAVELAEAQADAESFAGQLRQCEATLDARPGR